MSPSTSIGTKRPLRIAGASGGIYDRKRALHDLAKNEELDVIMGDWLSECNMTTRGSDKIDIISGEKRFSSVAGFEPYFLEELEPALKYFVQNKVKLCVNAGASDTEGLYKAVCAMAEKQGFRNQLNIAWVEGDDVTEAVMELIKKGEKFVNLPTGRTLEEWERDPLCAQCYLGGTGIAKAFELGADIVLCGRVADASPCIGAAMAHFGWTREDNIDEAASALMCGHVIECSTYATGGYYTGFKEFKGKDTDLGYPIASIYPDGTFVISMEKGRDGMVTPSTIAAQLVYEIQGPIYYNSDVTAIIEDVKMEQIGQNLVKVSGIKGAPAPPTTKVGITAKGGYQAEFHFYLTGLDIKEKAEQIERQVRYAMGKDIAKFDVLKFQWAGSVPEDPQSQDEATVDFRIFAQSRDPDVLSANAIVDSDRASFARYCIENLLQGYPGSTMTTDMRQAIGKPFFEYWVSLLPQSFVKEKVHSHDGKIIEIPTVEKTASYPRQQPSYDTHNPVSLTSFGPTTRAPLGYIVHGRSGDKASDCNVGLWVRHDDEWDWFRSFLSIDRMSKLLGKDYVGKKIDRFEMKNINAVHFLLRDHLDRGFNATSGYDSLGKNCCEYLRAKLVDIPNKFLDRGRI